MNFYIGTSGYAYPKWKGRFYPAKLPAKEMLGYYAARFHSVEINSTFYRPHPASTFESWASHVPADFRFVLKAPQEITHFRRLVGVEGSIVSLFEAAKPLKEKQGPLFVQLPPNFKKDVERLRGFLAILPPGCRAAFEFRHASWFDEDVFVLLREHNASLCIADADDELEVPFTATADWGYLRLRRAEYDKAALKSWAKRMNAQKWRDCFVFFKHEDEGVGPKMALELIELLGAKTK